MNQGIYEELVTQLVTSKLQELDTDQFEYKVAKLDREEAAMVLSKHIFIAFQNAIGIISGDNRLERQIDIANKMIRAFKEELQIKDFAENLIDIGRNLLITDL